MIVRLVVSLTDYVPFFKRWAWRKWYQHIAGYDTPTWSFMNYGYAPIGQEQPQLTLDPNDEDNRYCIQLYHHVASAVDLRGLDVLEVGSGRGGGASFVKRYLNPKTMTGVDFSANAVELCRRFHEVDGLSFQQGDAENLPFDDASFDAVINVESSHCYGSMPAFLKQVHRVLKPGGHFLFADFRADDVLDQQFADSDLTVVEQEDITPNVLEALRLDSERKEQLIHTHIRKRLVRTFKQFAGLKDSAVFESFQDGTLVYKRYVLQKPE